MIGDNRPGDNLYSDSIVALDAKSGTLKWHFQFTPHDVWDYDAQETPALVDATWQGRPRKLLLQANRNGFFYVLDRTDGAFLLGKQCAKNVTWASGLTAAGTADRGAEHGADARGQTRLSVARRRVELGIDGVQSGDESLLRADQRQVRHLHAHRHGVAGRQGLHGRIVQAGARRAGAARAARVRHSNRQAGVGAAADRRRRLVGRRAEHAPAASSSSARTAARLMAADAATGKPLWSFQTNALWKASPMTYMFDNKQYVAIASGSSIIAFGLPDQ